MIVFSLKVVGDMEEAIIQGKQPRRRFCMQDYGGQHCTRTPKHNVRCTVHVKGLADHFYRPNYHSIIRFVYMHLENG